jgi:hypothetical protein
MPGRPVVWTDAQRLHDPEGGYDLDSIGGLVLAVLEGFEETQGKALM